MDSLRVPPSKAWVACHDPMAAMSLVRSIVMFFSGNENLKARKPDLFGIPV
jgi:hypothetical protein